MNLNNAGLWLKPTLAAPGLKDLLSTEDIARICNLTTAITELEMSNLRSGRVKPNVVPEQWRVARNLTDTTRKLTDGQPSSCGVQLARTANSLMSLGRAFQFTP